jgi:uncharacterized protein (DUF58 family)
MSIDSALLDAEKLSAGHDALLLSAQKIVSGMIRGAHGRRRAGAGEKFWQFREYVAGDLPRDIDWRQTARRDETFVREREWEAAQSLWVYRDRSPSMNWRSRDAWPTKADFADTLWLAVSMLALEAGERVGLLGATSTAQGHVTALPKLLMQSAQMPTSTTDLPVPKGRRQQFLWLGDFYHDLEPVERFCAAAARQQGRVILVQVADPAEVRFDFSGRVRFEDIENRNDGQLIENAESLRKAYHEKFNAHRTALADIARQNQGVFMTVETDQSISLVFERLFDYVRGFDSVGAGGSCSG